MYISDYGNNRIRKVLATTGVISTIAGTGDAGYTGDGDQPTSANIQMPLGINLDSASNIYFGDGSYNVVRKITVSTGIISTVAGTGSAGYNGDNMQATAATLYTPYDVVLDSSDNLYIADRNNHRIRKVTVSTGEISTIVGTGADSSSGDGSEASSASISSPTFSRFDSAGNYYISEYGGYRIRKVAHLVDAAPTVSPTIFITPYTSVITTIAGSGEDGYSGDDEPATSADINGPTGIATDDYGNIYFSDGNNNRVRVVNSYGIIYTVAGNGEYGSSADDDIAATSAPLAYPAGVALHNTTEGNSYISLS